MVLTGTGTIEHRAKAINRKAMYVVLVCGSEDSRQEDLEMARPKRPTDTPSPPSSRAWSPVQKADRHIFVNSTAHRILNIARDELDETFKAELSTRCHNKTATYSDAIVWRWIWLRPGTEDPDETFRAYIKAGKL